MMMTKTAAMAINVPLAILAFRCGAGGGGVFDEDGPLSGEVEVLAIVSPRRTFRASLLNHPLMAGPAEIQIVGFSPTVHFDGSASKPAW
jgi:hypothetical protein